MPHINYDNKQKQLLADCIAERKRLTNWLLALRPFDGQEDHPHRSTVDMFRANIDRALSGEPIPEALRVIK